MSSEFLELFIEGIDFHFPGDALALLKNNRAVMEEVMESIRAGEHIFVVSSSGHRILTNSPYFLERYKRIAGIEEL